MSTLPDFTGPGFFAGEAPDGLTTIAGTPTSASVRVYWRDSADPDAPDVLVDSTQSAADGTWQIAGLNPALRYVVRAQKSQFDDVTVVGAAPSRTDVIAYVDQLVPREDELGNVDGLTGHVLLDSGLPPFTCEVIQPLPYGLSARVEGRKLLIEGVSADEGVWDSTVRVTASNGVWVDVQVLVEIQVPTDPHFDKVSLLLHMDGADGSTTFTDSSATPKAVTASGDAKISTAQSKFGGSSAYFDGNGDYVDVPGGADFDLGTVSTSSNLTVEFWHRPGVVGTNVQRLVSHALPGSGGSGKGGWSLYAESGILRLVISATSNATNPWYYMLSTSSAVFTAGVWCHVACVLSAGIPKLYINGVSAATTVNKSTAIFASTPIGLNTKKTDYGLRVGAIFTDNANPSTTQFLAGYIDDLRITKGVARYTENFAPPTNQFPHR